MRLLQIQLNGEFGLVERTSNAIPEYAILSHTWGSSNEEVSFQDFRDGTSKNKKGYRKLALCAKQAARDTLEYFWVDTCCIDKTSSAELSEAINSMYRWYQEAKVCYAYLADVPSENTIPSSKWFTRGWTLQELIAPAELVFFDEQWQRLGTKADLSQIVSECTRIPTEVLLVRENLDNFSIAQRMSWAASRETTRIEDKAYCLMGIFEINMPLIYGEGENAFIRLQEEIMKISDDHSLFAWRSPDRRGGCLAISPASFLDSSNIVQSNFTDTFYDPPIVSSRGIHLELRFMGGGLGRLGFAILNCCEAGNEDKPIAISVKDSSLTMRRFERTSDDFVHLNLRKLDSSRYPIRTICIQTGRATRVKETSGGSHSTLPTNSLVQDLSGGSMTANTFQALLEAAEIGTEDEVWLLLTRGDIEINTEDGERRTALCHAARRGEERIVNMLLGRGEVNVNSIDESGQTPLSRAAENGHRMVVELLLSENGIDINAHDSSGRTPLSWAAEGGHRAVAKQLLKREEIDIQAKDHNGLTALAWAARKGHVTTVEQLLKVDKVDINVHDGLRRTPLLLAAENGHEIVVKQLLNTSKVDINTQDYKRRTALLQAARNGHRMVVEQLLRTEKVDVNVHDGSRRTPLSWAAENGHVMIVRLLLERDTVKVDMKDTSQRTPLLWAAGNGHEVVVGQLLGTKVDVNAQDKELMTPLLWAARNGHETVVKLLLERDTVKVDMKDISWRTPLSWAAGNGHEVVVGQLLRNKKSRVNSEARNGRTILSWAAGNGHVEVVKMLLAEKKVKLNMKDAQERTPLSWARIGGHGAIVVLLQI